VELGSGWLAGRVGHVGGDPTLCLRQQALWLFHVVEACWSDPPDTSGRRSRPGRHRRAPVCGRGSPTGTYGRSIQPGGGRPGGGSAYGTTAMPSQQQKCGK